MNDQPASPYVEFGSWEVLLAALQRFSSAWVFRGQREYSWNLLTKLGRDLRVVDEDRTKDWLQLENSAIGYFMDRAGSLLVKTPDEHDLLGWLAFMQHYGAPTRLLDWSLSPYVALYFAYEQPSESDAALYALNSYLARRTNAGALLPAAWDHLGIMKASRTDAEGNAVETYLAREKYRRNHENEILRWAIESKSKCPLPTIPFDQDDRMGAQQTIFTLMGDVDTEVDVWFEKEKWEFPTPKPGGLIAGSDSMVWPLNDPSDLVAKIRLPGSWRGQVLTALSRMGISASSLFPGLDGIGRATSGHLLGGNLSNRDILTGWVFS
ncbi:FRG domain-containing protein [Streptomyces siamensis]|uniref:FRG domain-containing protein n=1 Tax=Streptomyces siamensis TaxID=1274986 RepID=A0ABP9JLF4_9ACTN